MASNSITSKQILQDETLLGGYAYQIIRQQSKRIFKLRSQVLADTDPEPLHQMRVGTRRLRSALTLFSDVVEIDSQSSDRSMATNATDSLSLQGIKKLTKALGKVRDLDVMQQWFEQVASGEGGINNDLRNEEKKTIQAVLKKLEKRRQKKFSRLQKTFDGKAYKKLKSSFKQWLKHPVFSRAAQQAAPRAAAMRIVDPLTHLLQHPGWLVATHQRNGQLTPKSITLPELDQLMSEMGEQIHDLRKQIKGIRYQTEFFRGLYDITYAAQVREFRNLQTILGELQDQIVIDQFLTDELGPDWAQHLPTIQDTFKTTRLDL